MNQRMKKMGFRSADDIEVKPRLIVSISGLEKQGKTHFALTAPGPIAFFSTDIGEEGVVGKFADKDIYVMDVDRADEDRASEAEESWEKFHSAYLALLRGNDVRTLILDTATEIWELLRLARFGRLTQVMPYQYGPVNKEYRNLIREAYSHDKNLILIHKMKVKYVKDQKTDEWERAGFADTGFLVQINAQVYRYDPEDGGEFAVLVEDCRQEPSLFGEELSGDMCSFPWVAKMALPEVGPEHWEV